MATVNLSAPWVEYYRKLVALFGGDKEIHIVYDEMDRIINIYVENGYKAGALKCLLPEVKTFGNMDLEINIIPANKVNNREALSSLYEDAFYGNPALSFVYVCDGIFTNPITYVVFVNTVVQYFNDDLGDIHGLCSTLYQNIAEEVFEKQDGIYFCTDIPTNGAIIAGFGKPLGEWP